MPRPLLFDAVVFDLDGTLIATDRFWIQAARVGARRAFDELGLDRPLPDAADWMSVVGLDLEIGFAQLFEDLEADQRARVLAACLEEEQRLLESGGAALMPGAEAALVALAEAGATLGIASNCSAGYLAHMLGELGLSDHVENAYCLDSPGVRNKSDMVRLFLERTGTRSAVMVGDRSGDRDAAWSNGIPHVHCAFGFSPGGAAVEAEATIEDLGALVPRLLDRTAWLEGLLERLQPGPGAVIGVTGGVAVGKSLFARDLARLLGAGARVLELDAYRQGSPPPDRPLTAYDLERFDRDWIGPAATERRADEPLVVAGPFLLDPAFRSRLDHTVHLEVPAEVRRRRLAARGERELARLRQELLPAVEAHAAHYRPDGLCDLEVEAANPLGPGSAAKGVEEPPGLER